MKEYILAIIRIITGLLLVYHGLEMFDPAKMNVYFSWNSIQALPAPTAFVFVGKSVELLGGLALAIGLFVRMAALAIMLVMLFICFYVGSGRIWYEDQHPFLLAMLAAIYLFAGAGIWSIDQKLLNHRK